ncbi:uncharacterized protein RJT20DRAFT_6039 [Scheffersomyces xylosifermentans]|uniref:uncharacterized protein n=1 Tax=Scheffersomyces xylosifermentans TaxID=1304137 RepID=UPI00315D23A8
MRAPIDISNVKDVLNWQLKFSEFDNEIQSWRESLPNDYIEFIDNNKLPQEGLVTSKDILFHSLYHTTITRLNSSVGYPYLNYSNNLLSFNEARAKCMDSASHIVSLERSISEGTNNENALYGPYYAFSMWVTARLFIVNAVNSDTQVPQDVHYLISVLNRMGQIWPSTMKYADILSYLISELESDSIDSINTINRISMGPKGENEAQKDMKHVISDMRLNAYSLDVILSVAKFKEKRGEKFSPNNQMDISNFFEWFRLPITELPSPM